MATAFRSDAEVTNGTAGTSVTVSKPAGIVDTGSNPGRDHLIAFIAVVGVPTITAPAGWTQVASAVDATNAVRMRCYRKLASSEGASWTWTLGSSVRNWGWVGAYTGVDPDDPVVESDTDLDLTTSTTLFDAFATIPIHAQGVAAGAAVRTASGVATTWTHTSTERADLSTNAGAGTDISGVVGDTAYSTGFDDSVYTPALEASQAQTAGVEIVVTLRPYFVPYAGGVGDTGLVLEAAFGVDPDSDSGDWTWTDLTAFGLNPEGVVLDHGRANRSTVADPSRMAFTLLNLAGEFTSPTGAYTQYMVRNLPFRVRLNGFGTDVGGTGYHRGTCFLASMKPRWDTSTNFAVVDIVAQGRLRRLQRRDDVLHSAAYTAIQRMNADDGYVTPVAYWPFEDESGSTSAASAVPGVGSALTTDVTFGSDSTIVGSASLAVLAATSTVRATIPVYADTGTWTAMFAYVVPTEPAAATTLLDVFTTGTAAGWTVGITPGAPTVMFLQIYDRGGTQIHSQTVNLDEAEFYGAGHFYTLTATQNGTGIDFTLTATNTDGTGTAITNSLASRTCGMGTSFRVPSAAGLEGLAFGHLALHVAPGAAGLVAALAVLTGNSVGGDFTWERFQRLCQEQGVPYSIGSSAATFTDITMGPQTVATFMSLVRECEDIENAPLNDSGQVLDDTGLLWLPSVRDRENIDPSMTLDVASGQVAPSFEPALDDEAIVNDVEVSRVDGSSARVTDEDSIAVEGRYRERVRVNTFDDEFLAQLAGWRVNLGTVRGMRFPSVVWNLRRSTDIVEQWMATRLFHRIDITNPPSQYPPDDIQAILEGYTEVLAADEWMVRGNLSPYEPYKIFEISDTTSDQSEWVGRLAGDDNAAIRVAIDSDDTSIEIDPNRYRWTTVADDFDPDLRVRFGGETADVSSIATTAGTYVAAGAMSSADNAAVTPAMYAGATTRDLICVLARIRSASAGTISITDGYTRLPITGFTASSPMQLWAKVHDGSESDPTVTPTGGSAGDTVSAVTFGLRGTPSTLEDLADIVVDSLGQANASAANIAYPGLFTRYQEGCIVLALGGKDDDWTSVATLSGFTEAVDSSTTTGSDQGLVVDYVIQTTPAVINEGSFTVTGGASAVSEGALVAIAAGYQTLTVSARSANGLVASHAAGTEEEVVDAFVLGL